MAKITSNEVAKSSILIQREKELKELDKKKEKALKNIKANKDKIEATKQILKEVQELAQAEMSRLATFTRKSKRVIDAATALMQKRKISTSDAAEIRMLLNSLGTYDVVSMADNALEGTPFGNFENFEKGQFGDPEEFAKQFTDEFDRSREKDFFSQFSVKIDEKTQQNLRKEYVSLAARFHPDKAKNEAEAAVFNELMQHINDAYKGGDLATLLEIKEQYKDYTEGGATDAYDLPILDALEAQVLRKRNEVAALENQADRLKAEHKALSSSNEIKHAKKMHEQSKDDDSNFKGDSTAILGETYDILSDILEEWTEKGKKPKSFKSFLDGSHPIHQKLQLLDSYNDDDDDDNDDDDIEFSDEEIRLIQEMMSMMGGAFERQNTGAKKNAKKGTRK